MEAIGEWFTRMKEALSIPLLRMGETEITLWSVLHFLVLLLFLLYLTGKIKRWVANWLLSKTRIDYGVRQAIGSITQYTVLVIGLLIIMQTAGIDLTTLNVLAGAVGIGIGLGLQNIANNFISGLIILFERPIKLGDRIEVANVEGDVVNIGTRSTTVVTNDNITIIIPNSKLISENVVNWSHNDDRVRFRIPVLVSYGSDVRVVEKLLLDVAAEHPSVLKDPPPGVRLMEFGDNGILFELRPWTMSLTHRKGKLVSDLNFGIHKKFVEHKIEFPFPQRDIHIKSGIPPPA